MTERVPAADDFQQDEAVRRAEALVNEAFKDSPVDPSKDMADASGMPVAHPFDQLRDPQVEDAALNHAQDWQDEEHTEEGIAESMRRYGQH